MHTSWKELLKEEASKPYFAQLKKTLEEEQDRFEIYPPVSQVFTAFESPAFEDIKVVILGQDPYHGPGQAHGLAFSVPPGVRPPPSLHNIFLELENDLGTTPVLHGYLKAWTERGVFLLNTILTVRKGQPGSHRNIGWNKLTDRVIQLLSARERRIVFLLWGKAANLKSCLIDTSKHKIVSSAHPSPMSARAGFFYSRPFSKANKILAKWGGTPIDWQLPDL